MKSAMARARANIALVKYWGKANLERNLPATGSISLTCSSLRTTTQVEFERSLVRDELRLDSGVAPEHERLRVSRFLDRVRALAGIEQFARVDSSNDFPTAAGLASSASGFAALAAAATRAAGLDLPHSELASLARLGSGSASRSLLGGFVELAGSEHKGPEAWQVRQIAPPEHWDIRLVVALTDGGRKKVGSSEGMERSRFTSPYFDSWVRSHPGDMTAARQAILDKDFGRLGRVAESSCFKMHALAMSSRPPLLYFNPVTVAAISKVWEMREAGLEGYVTIDAGPHVKVLCLPGEASAIAHQLGNLSGVARVWVEEPGAGLEHLA
jgi:diphosphomevalonate decarboxylase